MEHRQGQTGQVMAKTKRHGAGHDDEERGDDEVDGDVRKGDEVPYLELV